MGNNLITPKAFYNIINKDNVIIGIDKIYELCKTKSFPSLKMGGRYYIILNKVDEWFDKQAEKYWSSSSKILKV